MIERVARAICNATGEFDWDEDGESMRSQFIKEARAAIGAMREPTEDMVFAGHEPLEASVGFSNGEPYFDVEGPAQTFTAMIDAALEE